MPAGKRDFAARHQDDRPRVAADRGVDEVSVARIDRRPLSTSKREPHLLGLTASAAVAPGERLDSRVVEVSDEPVAHRLVGADAVFRFGVLVHRGITVEVIGRNVEQDGNARFERAYRLELKRRHLGHDPLVALGIDDLGDQRVADVAADSGSQAAGAKQMTDQRGGRRFAFGSRYGDLSALCRGTIRKFDLTDHRNVCPVNCAHDG